ncbi:MAG: hypothetical protein II288_03715 [Alistipes sp.]|jgi:hypothetical protein|nr:hypothetical protein [Alistipes sp.]
MNTKLKVFLLSCLGLSAAACCSTKKAKNAEQNNVDNTEVDVVDPRIQLMYGVPMPPDGEVVRPLPADNDGVPFPDGRVVSPLTEEEAAKRIEQMREEQAAEQE